MTDDRKDTSSLVSVSQTDLITWLGRDGIVGSTLDLRGNDLTGRRSEMGVHGVNIRRRFDPWSTDIEGALRHQEIYRSMNSLCLSVVWTLHWDGTNYHIYKTHLPASYLVHDREALTIKMRSGTPILAGHRKEPELDRKREECLRGLGNAVVFTGQMTGETGKMVDGNTLWGRGECGGIYRNVMSMDTILGNITQVGEPVTVNIIAEPMPYEAMTQIVDALLRMISFAASKAETTFSVNHSRTETKGRDILDPSKRKHRAVAGILKGLAGGLAAGAGMVLSPVTGGASLLVGMAVAGGIHSIDVNDMFGWNARISTSVATGDGQSVSAKSIDEGMNFYATKYRELLSLIDRGGQHGLWTWYGTVHARNSSVAEAVARQFAGRLSVLGNTLEPIRLKRVPVGGDESEILEEAVLGGYTPLVEGSFGPLGRWYGSLARTETLPYLFAGPTREIGGLETYRVHPTALQVPDVKKGLTLGHVPNRPEEKVTLSVKDLKTHLFIGGKTGSGKTLLLRRLLREAGKLDKPIRFVFLDFAQHLHLEDWEFAHNALHYESGREFEPAFPPLGLLDYSVPDEYDNYVWMLADLLTNWIPSEGPLTLLIQELLQEAFKEYKTDEGNYFVHPDCDVPRLAELEHHIASVLQEGDTDRYAGELKANLMGAMKTRIRRLASPAMSAILDGKSDELFLSFGERDLLVSLASSGSTNERCFLGLVILAKIRQWLRNDYEQQCHDAPRIIIAIDEAHILLRKAPEKAAGIESNVHAYAVKFFDELIAEIRQLGGAMIVLDQSPGLLADSVLFSTGNKAVFSLASGMDQQIIADSIGVPREKQSAFGNVPERVGYLKTQDSSDLFLFEVPIPNASDAGNNDD